MTDRLESKHKKLAKQIDSILKSNFQMTSLTFNQTLFFQLFHCIIVWEMFGWGTTHILITLPPVCRMKGERLRDGRRKGK